MRCGRKKIKYLAPLCGVLLAGLLACGAYLKDFYHADLDRIEAFSPVQAVERHRDAEGTFLFGSDEADAGLIFYPGGKVEYTAYIPLMEQLAARGIFCVLVEMPFHLAVLDSDAAEGIPARYPQIEHWYIGGHSLGGAMAASYLSKSGEDFEGLVLLGAYSTADLSAADVSVLSVYGSEDMVLDREKYEQNRKNLPEVFQELVIDGGCHAYFGMYGAQEGDGTPTITNEEQITLTAEAIADVIGEPKA